ncbi:hypothetical protein [Deinococcus pimensis]|uniref:hypothetical protein n=1 Tax=Deinococcus pimensis TaxID=309888 RepID=UPI000489A0D4|nr:hypothetical protein [Deinococcus pimensis]
MDFPTSPRSLRDADARARRHELLALPHAAPLSRYVEDLRARLRAHEGDARQLRRDHGVPHLDPLSGGVLARALLLLEAPGPRALSHHLALALPGEDGDVLYGTIHSGNHAALAAARHAGRHDVLAEVFVRVPGS